MRALNQRLRNSALAAKRVKGVLNGAYCILFGIFVAGLVTADAPFSVADPLPNGAPAVNTPMVGCVDGRAVRYTSVSGVAGLNCTSGSTPAVSSCGTGASLSANATDNAGQINVGTGSVLSCTLAFSKTYSPALGCIAQTNSNTIMALPTVTGTAMTLAISLSLAGGKITYVCFPV